MKRLTVIAATIMLTAAASAAQAQNPAPGGGPGAPGGPGARGPARRVAMLMQGITLTTEQQARVDSILARYQAQMPAFTPGTPPDSAAMARRRELTQQQDAEIRAVLTAEQQTVFDRNAEAVRNMGPGGRRP